MVRINDRNRARLEELVEQAALRELEEFAWWILQLAPDSDARHPPRDRESDISP